MRNAPRQFSLYDLDRWRPWMGLVALLTAACTNADVVVAGTVAERVSASAEAGAVGAAAQDAATGDASGAVTAGPDAAESASPASDAGDTANDSNWLEADAADANPAPADSADTAEGAKAGDAGDAAEAGGGLNDAAAPAEVAANDALATGDGDGTGSDGTEIADAPAVTDGAGDGAAADVAGDSTGADLAAACTLDAATWPGPPDTALLPGESTACQALGIAACVLVDSEWSVPWAPGKGPKTEPDWVNYVCFDAAGTAITSAVVHPSKGIDELAKKLPCSAAQLQKWQAAYQQPCWKMVPSSAMPVSLLTLLFDSKKLPAQVCSNIDGTRFAMTAACSEFVYTIEKQSKKLGPDPGDLFVGIYMYYWGFDGATWHVVATPASVAIFDSKYPVFSCNSFWLEFIVQATAGYWGAGLDTAGDPKVGKLQTEVTLNITESAGMPKNLAGWKQVLVAAEPKLYDNPCLKFGK